MKGCEIMKILVTGGTVFVSRYVAEYFVMAGHEVFVLNRNSRPQSDGVILLNGDRHALGDTLKNLSFDWVIDVTAYNSDDVSHLLNALDDFGGYIMISSSAVYPETLSQPFSEVQTVGENIHWGAYGTNKIGAETTLHSCFPNGYIIRPPYLCGKINNLYREAYIFDCAEKALPIFVPHGGDMKLHFFDVEDLCRVCEKIMETRPEQKILNVGNYDTVAVREWIEMCCEAVGKITEIRTAPEDIPVNEYFPFRDYEYALDVTRQREFLPNLKPLEQSIAESYEWYKSHRRDVRRKNFIEFVTENFI